MATVVVRSMSTGIRQVLRTGKIHDNTGENVIYISLNAEHNAEVQYNAIGDVYELVHTNIPQEYQGYGLGTVLAERVFDHLIERKKKIKLSCEFLQQFYSKNTFKYKNYVIE